jgi:microcystin-dependent protein
MALTPADTLANIAAPSASNSGLPAEEFPGMRNIQRTDLVGPVATNKPHAALEKRTLSMRDKVNNLIDVVNQLDSYYVRAIPAAQKNGLIGFQSALPMNGHAITDLPTDAIGLTGNDDLAVSRAQLKAFATEAAAIPAGFVWMFGGVIPSGWLLCNGADYDPNDPLYTPLYNVIGYIWGSVGGRFKVPNFSRRFPVGALGGYAVGELGGEESHVLSWDEMPVHTHEFAQTDNSPVVAGGIPATASQREGTNTSNTGSGYAHENRPPFTAVNFAIKF